jgi:hypothetical protein
MNLVSRCSNVVCTALRSAREATKPFVSCRISLCCKRQGIFLKNRRKSCKNLPHNFTWQETRSVGLLLYRQSPADLRYGSVLAADPHEQRMRLNNNISLPQRRMSSSIMCGAPPNVDILSRSKSLASLKLSPCNRTSMILRFPDSCR